MYNIKGAMERKEWQLESCNDFPLNTRERHGIIQMVVVM
jgi:hypothetical protein